MHKHIDISIHIEQVYGQTIDRLTEREADRFREMSNYLISIEETALE